jgi:hypothetical protein
MRIAAPTYVPVITLQLYAIAACCNAQRRKAIIRTGCAGRMTETRKDKQ